MYNTKVNKIVKLCVGGKKIKTYESTVEQFDIHNSFIDMDPTIFNYIINLSPDKTKHHKKYINTMVKLGILPSDNYIKPKIILDAPIDYTLDDRYEVYTIDVRGKIFKTYKKTIIKAPFFAKQLENKTIFVDKDYKAFACILNLLRNNEICFFPDSFINDLNFYEIEYSTKKICDNGYCRETYDKNVVGVEGGLLQIVSNSNSLNDPKLQSLLQNHKKYSNVLINENDKIYTTSSSSQYFVLTPDHSISHEQQDTGVLSIIEKQVDIDFGKTLVFDLSKHNYGDLIDDLVISIELNGLNNGLRWVNNLGHLIIKRLYFNLNDTTVISFTGEYLDIQNKLLNKYGYEEMNFVYNNVEEGIEKSSKYNRIMIPINLKEKIPVADNMIKMLLYVELADFNKCVIPKENKIIRPNNNKCLSNFTILSNYINLVPNERKQIINNPNLYIYNNVILVSQPINVANKIDNYCTTTIPLNHFEYVKDIIIVIHTDENIKNNDYFNYSDELLDVQLVLNNETLFKLDKLMMNKYLPLKYFNKLPRSNGIYYYSFSSNPKSNKLFGGLNVHFNNDEYKANLIIKTKVTNGTIHVYSNNYFITVL